MTFPRSLSLLSLLLLTTGCPGTPVEYSVTCEGAECPNADQTVPFGGGQDESLTCTWNCASYDGQDDVRVDLVFRSFGGGCWSLSDEIVTSGSCD